jgi:hypothetical protein
MEKGELLKFRYEWQIRKLKCETLISSFRHDVDEICALLEYYQRRVVIVYRRFGTTYRSRLHGSRVREGKKSSKL